MKTLAIAQQVVASTPSTAQPIFWRFAWKEFRMLRGFWLAVGGLAVAQQAIALMVRAPVTNGAAMLFASALGAAALYAVGAAAMLYAVEHEEETFGFLSTLPATWLPVFAGKLLVATASALALAAALCLSGRLLAGDWPVAHVAVAFLGIFGFAIFEALAWGTLFSLRLKRPLTAALLAICAASLVLQLLVSLGTDSVMPSLMLESYLAVLPWRLLVVAMVLTADVLLARGWWPVSVYDPAARRVEPADVEPLEFTTTSPIAARFAQIVSPIVGPVAGWTTRCAIGRLGWQTWRASWRTMLVMLLATGLLSLLAIVVLLPLADHWQLPGWLYALGIGLIGSALYGSSIFHANQRQMQYRFLAEHAGRGRAVWSSRLAVWSTGLGLLLLIGLLGYAFYTAATVGALAQHLARAWVGNEYTNYRHLDYTVEQWTQIYQAIQGTVAGVFGMFAGLAIGQFSSLVLRRSLVAALLAAVLALVLFAWSALVIAWALPWWSCLLPVPLGLLWAAWLRAPDWLIERNHVRGWGKVLAAAGLPVVLVACLLPAVRVGQVPDQDAARQHIEGLLSQVARDATIEARRAGDRLLLLRPRIEPIKVPRQQRDDDRITEADRFVYRGQQVAANRRLIAQTVEQTAHSACRFPPLSVHGVWQQPFHQLLDLAKLLTWAGDQATAKDQLERALEYYLAALRIHTGMHASQPSPVIVQSIYAINQVERQIALWAGHPGQTSAQIRQTVDQLGRIVWLPPADESAEPATKNEAAFALAIDDAQVRDVLNEKNLPRTLGTGTSGLAYLANKLPFERTRALRVLTALTTKHLDTLELVHQRLDQQRLRQKYLEEKQRIASIRPVPESASQWARQLRSILQTAQRQDEYTARQLAYLTHRAPWDWLSTSYLLRDEYEVTSSPGRLMCAYAPEQVNQLGLRVQLALITYQLDQGNYPDKLQALVPKYLPYVPIDPFSGRPMAYEPDGLPYSLRLRHGRIGQAVELAAQTPFVWSVGVSYAVLERVAADSEVNDAQGSFDQTAQGAMAGRAIWRYRFHPQEPPRVHPTLIFPLPK